ncbi:hypothetical protein J4465_01115 [Candidatus Pacearchaeota archaeon]|nr:hypothetical protein [Candidatus Pacearchaeota archaeon]
MKKGIKAGVLGLSLLLCTFLYTSSIKNIDAQQSSSKKYKTIQIDGEATKNLLKLIGEDKFSDPEWEYGTIFEENVDKTYNGIIENISKNEKTQLRDITILFKKRKVIAPNKFVEFFKEKNIMLEINGSAISLSFDKISSIYTKSAGEITEIKLKTGGIIKGKYIGPNSGFNFYHGKQKIAGQEYDFKQRIDSYSSQIKLTFSD